MIPPDRVTPEIWQSLCLFVVHIPCVSIQTLFKQPPDHRSFFLVSFVLVPSPALPALQLLTVFLWCGLCCLHRMMAALYVLLSHTFSHTFCPSLPGRRLFSRLLCEAIPDQLQCHSSQSNAACCFLSYSWSLVQSTYQLTK